MAEQTWDFNIDVAIELDSAVKTVDDAKRIIWGALMRLPELDSRIRSSHATEVLGWAEPGGEYGRI